MAVGAVLAAVAAVWVTLDADFLAHPGWLAVQKADFILGPVFVGLYWRRVRPESRFGLLLIAFGAVGAVYILQSSSNPWLFGISLQWENAIYLCTLVLILTFPTGRLDGLAAKLIVFAAVVVAAMYSVTMLLVPQIGAEGSISGCRALCPDNALAVTSNLPLAVDLIRLMRFSVMAIEIATAGLLIWRMVTGTPPQRRALMIGVPIALLFTAFQITSDILKLVHPDGTALESVIQWGMAGARSLIWYGFLFALIAAQLFAGRVLHSLVRQSLQRPSQRELEAMLREPLGDPRLRLALWDPATETWAGADADEVALRTPEPGSGRDLAIVERGDGRPAVAIVHDAQLDDDPELLRAAGAVALLAAENAELEAGWKQVASALAEARRREGERAIEERHRIARDLHDFVSQSLFSAVLQTRTAQRQLRAEGISPSDPVAQALGAIAELTRGVQSQVRSVIHQLDSGPAEEGLLAALDRHASSVGSQAGLVIDVQGSARDLVLPPDVELQLFGIAREALANVVKHAVASVASVRVDSEGGRLVLEIRDDGRGFDPSVDRPGHFGLESMRGRAAEAGALLTIRSAPGRGTIVRVEAPATDAG